MQTRGQLHRQTVTKGTYQRMNPLNGNRKPTMAREWLGNEIWHLRLRRPKNQPLSSQH